MFAASGGTTNWLDIGGGLLIAVFAAALALFDRYLATRPSRDLLLEYLATLKGGAGHLSPTDPTRLVSFNNLVGKLNTQIDTATETVAGKCDNRIWKLLRPISVTKVLSTWREAHSIEVTAWELAGEDEVVAHLATLKAELDLVSLDKTVGSVASALSQRAAALLAPLPPTDPKPKSDLIVSLGRWTIQRTKSATRTGASSRATDPTPEDARSLLKECAEFLFAHRDLKFQNLASRQTQSVWLAFFALMLIIIASVTAHRQSLFVFGAIGAFISRLARVQSGSPHEDDYGVSSGAIYLSLAAGAIAGWIGVLLVNALALPSIHVLSESFRGIWNNPTEILASAIAVAFGFSERLLNKVLRQTSDSIAGGSKPSSSASPAAK